LSGILALFFPVSTMASLVLLFAAYMILDGVIAMIAALRSVRAHKQWDLLDTNSQWLDRGKQWPEG